MSVYVSLALVILNVVSWVMNRLTDKEREEVYRQRSEQLRIKAEGEAVSDAEMAYERALLLAAADPPSLRAPDPYSRT